MPAIAPIITERPPRRARHLVPMDAPHRAEFLAGLTLVTLLAASLLAPLPLLLAVAFHAVSRVSRWSPRWLGAPAAVGVIWVLAVGPGGALAGFGAAAGAVAGLLSHALTHLASVPLLAQVPSVLARRASRQLPVGMILAAGAAAIAWWVRWLHTDEWAVPAPRVGLASICRRRWTAAFVRSGGIVTRDGACLGVDLATGRPAAVSWREAGGGVLITGEAPAALTAEGFQLAHAAIRRRKPVVVVDLAGSGLAAALAEVCAAAAAPLRVFGPDWGAHYDPLRDRDPVSAADLVMGVIDWGQVGDPARSACRECLIGAFEVLAARPGDPGRAAFDEVTSLLRPAELLAAVERVPAWQPGRAELAERGRLAAAWLESEQAPASLVAAQLGALCRSPLGRWLAPDPTARERISLGQVVRERSVALFPLARTAHGHAADAIATMVALDLADLYERREGGALAEGMAWFGQCDGVDRRALARLTALSGRAEFATVLTTGTPEVAGELASQVSVCLVNRLRDWHLACQLAPLTGTRLVPAAPNERSRAGVGDGAPNSVSGVPTALASGAPVLPSAMTRSPMVPADALCLLGDEEFVLTVCPSPGRAGQPGAERRMVTRGQALAGRVPGPARPPAFRHASSPGRWR